MTIYNTNYKTYTSVSKEMLRDDRISYGAKGVMCFIESHFDYGDKIDKKKLYIFCNESENTEFDGYLKELVKYGYLAEE